MKTRKKYIPTPEFWREMFLRPNYEGRWTIVDKVPVDQIKVDKSLFAFQNEVDLSQVDFMIENFDVNFWIPITVNTNYFLLDGQHRLKVAQGLGLKSIDVVVDHGEQLPVSLQRRNRHNFI
jgi:hypothetical protein